MTETQWQDPKTDETAVTTDELTTDEIEAQDAAELPDREAMSLVDANVAVPVNAAVAANVLSDGSVAIADASQDVDIDQSTDYSNFNQ